MKTTHGLKRRMSALATVLGIGMALPFTVATPAEAEAVLGVTKSHEGTFARGGQGLYTITLDNSGSSLASSVVITDTLPAGLTVANFAGDIASACRATGGGRAFRCDGFSIGASPLTLEVTVNIADDAPCSVVNTVTVTAEGADTVSDSHQTKIIGGDCDSGGGSSLLPIRLDGILTAFNNISTSNNINSPRASNAKTMPAG